MATVQGPIVSANPTSKKRFGRYSAFRKLFCQGKIETSVRNITTLITNEEETENT